MKIQEIQSVLLHRFPMLLVDRVTELQPNQRIAGYKNVTANEPFFTGHFPEYPIMPGVLILEAMTQLCGILSCSSENKNPARDGTINYITGADQVKFRQPVIPGDRLDMEAELTAQRQFIRKFTCRASVAGVLVAEAKVTVAEKKRSAL